MKVSIIIRTKNEAKTLSEVLQGIKKQVYDGEIEIIVVDSGSRDNTLVHAREGGCNIVEVPEKDFSFGRAINEGVKKAKGELIVLLSGHTPPVNENWLQNLIDGFGPGCVEGVELNKSDGGSGSGKIVAAFGRQIPLKDYDPFEEWQFYRNFPSRISPARSLVLKGDAFSNANCAIRRDALLKYPFDEKLPGSEDREWAGRVKKNGFKIKYVPESQVYHSHPLSYRAIYERKFIQAKARKLVYPGSCRYDNIFWLSGAIITTVLIDIVYCLYKGYFRFLPKIFPYRYYYFLGLVNGVKADRL